MCPLANKDLNPHKKQKPFRTLPTKCDKKSRRDEMIIEIQQQQSRTPKG